MNTLMFYRLQLIALGLLALTYFLLPITSFAQDIYNSPPVNQQTEPAGFNAVWLLPLFFIPFIAYLLWPKKKQDQAQEGNSSGEYAGAKGGSAQRDEEDDEDKFI